MAPRSSHGIFVAFVLALHLWGAAGPDTVAHADEPGGALRAGAAAVDITPTRFPIRTNGGFTEKLAERAIDRLHARALALDDGTTCVILCVVDSCMMPRELVDRAKATASASTGVPVERMLVSATHTHTAPAVAGVHGTDPEPEYAAFLEHEVARCLDLAHSRLERARVGHGSAPCPEFVFCRRWIMKEGTALDVPFTGRADDRAQMNPGNDNPNKLRPTGPADPDVTVVALERTSDGSPLAVLANYSTHYAGSSQVSADYFGEFAKLLEERAARTAGRDSEGPFVAMMTNGTSGDANCIDFSLSERRRFDHFEVAASVAKAAISAWEEVEYSSDVPVRMVEELLEFDVRMPSAAEVAEARAWLEENVGDRPVRNVTENYARETVLLSELPPTRELRLQAVRIGDLAIAAIPCEVYGSTGLEIKESSPFARTMTISLANGAEGYIPPPEQFELGGYTTWRARSSCLEIDAEPRIREKVLELIASLEDG